MDSECSLGILVDVQKRIMKLTLQKLHSLADHRLGHTSFRIREPGNKSRANGTRKVGVRAPGRLSTQMQNIKSGSSANVKARVSLCVGTYVGTVRVRCRVGGGHLYGWPRGRKAALTRARYHQSSLPSVQNRPQVT